MKNSNELVISGNSNVVDRRIDAWIDHGLSILDGQEPTELNCDRVLLHRANIYAVELPGSARFSNSVPRNAYRSNRLQLHTFNLEGAYIETVSFYLLELHNLKDSRGIKGQLLWILNGNLHVLEALYYGRCFIEHIFDLDGTLLCVLSDDPSLSRTQGIPASLFNPTFITSNGYWTASIHTEQRYARLRNTTAWVVPPTQMQSFQPPIQFLDRSELLRRVASSHQLQLFHEVRDEPLGYIAHAKLPVNCQEISGSNGIWTLHSTKKNVSRASFYQRVASGFLKKGSITLSDSPSDSEQPLEWVAAGESEAIASQRHFSRDPLSLWYRYFRFEPDSTISRRDTNLGDIIKTYCNGDKQFTYDTVFPSLSNGVIATVVTRLELGDELRSIFTYNFNTGTSTLFKPMVPQNKLIRHDAN